MVGLAYGVVEQDCRQAGYTVSEGTTSLLRLYYQEIESSIHERSTRKQREAGSECKQGEVNGGSMCKRWHLAKAISHL